jgi:hypothetical protein
MPLSASGEGALKRDISVRFYGIERMNPADPAFVDVVQEIYKKDHKDRTVDCDGLDMRLEHLEKKSGKWFGEFTRIQGDDFPSEVTPTGRQALATENDLGHSIVFCFDPSTSILALRSDKTPVSPRRIETYLSEAHPGASFHMRPKMKKDAWKEFKKKPLKKFEVKLAGFTDMSDLEGDDMAAFQGLGLFREAYNSHTITISLSMGHKKGFLAEGIKKTAESLLGREDEDFEVRSMKAKPGRGSTGAREPELNLLEQILSDKETVDLPKNDPDLSFKIICAAILRSLLRNKGNL